MGQLEKNLIKKLMAAGYNVTTGTLPYPTFDIIRKSEYYDEIKNTYKKLGGILDEVPLNLRKWDVEVNGIALELDEYLHFNRYRKITLESILYNQLPKFPLTEYLNYCKYYEQKCIDAGSYGGKWTNASCEKQFGKASPNKVFTGVGSPRWKQRAFYDFVKDLTPLMYDFPLVRISIYDKVPVNNDQRQVKEILEYGGPFGTEELYKLIESRV